MRARLEYNGFRVNKTPIWAWRIVSRRWAVAIATVLLCAAAVFGQANNSSQSSAPPATTDQQSSADKSSDKPDDKPKTAGSGNVRLRIQVTDPNDKPVGNASVYVRYYTAGGLLRREKLQEMDLKTNQNGSVKVPDVPQGKILIQIIAKGWHTYGKWYDIEQEEQNIAIKLEPPPHWY
jgi:hypothetical protein